MIEVKKEDLEVGKEYYIQCLTEDENKNLVNDKHSNKLIGTFEKLEEWESHSNNGFKFIFFKFFRSVNQNIFLGYNVRLNLFWKFYEIKKHVIQQNMETRACNLFLQEVLGDQYFKIEFI